MVRVVELVVAREMMERAAATAARTCNDIVGTMALMAQMQQALTLDMSVPIAEASTST